MMNLSDFESYIDRIIFARGYDYYENDYVVSIEETDDNVYEAEVEGAELYTVKVKLDDEANIIGTQCDCPYDMGEYCKHQVAVFLVLRDKINKNSAAGNHLPKNSINLESLQRSKTPRESKTRDIEKILSGRTKEELVEFLLDISSEHEEIKQRIELNFDDANDVDEINKSIELIRTFIRNNSDRHSYVNYRNTSEAVRGADLVLEKAHTAFNQNKTIHALDLILCVIHEMMDLLDNADDSSGTVGGVISESFGFINKMIEDEELSPADKESFFNKLIEEANNRWYDGWTDWRLDLLGSCSVLADTPVLRNRMESHLLSMIENEEGDSWSVNYFEEKVNLIRYSMVLQNDGEKMAQELINQNLQYSSFRKMAIENAMQKKDYDLIIKLTLEGEKKDKSLPGLINNWKKYRYKAYQLSGNLDEQRGIAMDYILDGNFEYYKELKSTYDSEEWLSDYPKIIFLLENQKRIDTDIYTRILIEEGEKEKLLEYVKKSPSSVESYYKHLIPEFKAEVYDLFLRHIEQTSARSGNRRDYQGVCAIIRNLIKAGGKDQALGIKQKLFAQYANRPAFRDELTRV